jgi:hypothetical protein
MRAVITSTFPQEEETLGRLTGLFDVGLPLAETAL